MRDRFLEGIADTIEKHGLIPPGGTVWAGVSGGADSVCLLLALHELSGGGAFTLRAVHVEHGIRGGESLQDAAFVEALCGRLQIPCSVIAVNVPERAAAEGLSLEEAGRICRYEVFDRLCADDPLARIALAHQMEDQAETVLFHLARGSGLRGLGGIRHQRGRIIRPLLDVSRAEIEAWLQSRGESWRTDRTNLETDYARNRIRHQILPLLSGGINAQAVRHICEAAARADEAEQYIQEQADAFAARYVTAEDEGRTAVISLTAFNSQPLLLREYVLRTCIFRVKKQAGLKNVGTIHINDLIELAGKPRGKRLDLPGYLKALRRGKELVLYVDTSGKQQKKGKRAGTA